MTEPSLLDYLAAKLRFWRTPAEGLPSLRRLWSDDGTGETVVTTRSHTKPHRRWLPGLRLERGEGPPPLAVASALALALIGQTILTGSDPLISVALVLLVGAAGAMFFAVRRGEVPAPADPENTDDLTADSALRPGLIPAAAAAAILTTVMAAGNRAGPLLMVVWLVAVGLSVAAVTTAPGDLKRLWSWTKDQLSHDHWSLGLQRGALLPMLLIAGALLVRTSELARIPAEMLSVHAELLLSVLQAGQPHPPIVFPWGPGGLEPIPVFLDAVLAPLAGGLSFASLKLGTLLAGLVTLPLIYLLGREVGGRAAGLGGMALAAVGTWPNVVSRIGLTEGWYPPFAAAALLLLLRGIRRNRRIDFVAAGIVIGLAIQTVSMARSLVLMAVVLVGVALISAGTERRRRLIAGFGVVLIFAVVAGLPTLAATTSPPLEDAPLWWFGAADGSRAQSTVSGIGERSARVLLLPLWSDGPAWNHGGGERPALDRVAGALLVLGVGLAATGAIRRRRLLDGLLLISVPLLMLPAILVPLDPGLAPSPLRCGGALAPVFALAGLGLASVARAAAASLAAPIGRGIAAVATILLVGLSALAGWTVVHGSFAQTWNHSAWNTSELGEVARGALALGVPIDRIRVVPYPHWVDTRLVGAETGFPGTDMALDQESVDRVASRPGPQAYLIHPRDHRSLQILRKRVPTATTFEHSSKVEGKNFLVFIDLSVVGGG